MNRERESAMSPEEETEKENEMIAHEQDLETSELKELEQEVESAAREFIAFVDADKGWSWRFIDEGDSGYRQEWGQIPKEGHYSHQNREKINELDGKFSRENRKISDSLTVLQKALTKYFHTVKNTSPKGSNYFERLDRAHREKFPFVSAVTVVGDPYGFDWPEFFRKYGYNPADRLKAE